MNVSKLLRFLLSQIAMPGIVEAGAGGAADDATQSGAGDDDGEFNDDEDGEDTAGGADGSDTAAGAESEGGETDEGTDTAAGAAGGDGEGDELVVQIGDDTAPAAEGEDPDRAPQWLRDLRKSDREKTRVIREQQREIDKLKGTTAAPAAVVVGEKPVLEEFADAEQIAKHEAALEAWHERKRKADEQAAEKKRADDAAAAAWAAKVDGYKKAAAGLKVKDFEDAEATTLESLNVVQQGIVLQGAKRPELVVYALGKNPKKAKELGEIADPVKFAFAVANLERDLKVTTRKQAPAPERIARGGGAAGTTAIDNQLEKLRAEAAKTGDMTKLIAYKNQQRQKQRA